MFQCYSLNSSLPPCPAVCMSLFSMSASLFLPLLSLSTALSGLCCVWASPYLKSIWMSVLLRGLSLILIYPYFTQLPKVISSDFMTSALTCSSSHLFTDDVRIYVCSPDLWPPEPYFSMKFLDMCVYTASNHFSLNMFKAKFIFMPWSFSCFPVFS